MKKTIIILLSACLSAAVLSSCSKTDIAPVPIKNLGSNTGTPAKDKDNVTPSTPHDPILGNINPGTLTGTWKLVRDSSSYSDGTSGSAYKGVDADYFQFAEDGKLYIQENGLVDTANYTINTDKSISVNYLVYNSVPVNGNGSNVTNFKQVGLTGNSVTLTSSVASTTGIIIRNIDLKR
jgi:hypothetical protein